MVSFINIPNLKRLGNRKMDSYVKRQALFPFSANLFDGSLEEKINEIREAKYSALV